MAFEKKTKDTVMDKILSFFGNFEYAKSFINNDVIKKSELISDYTSKHIDDEVCGVYNNVKIDVIINTTFLDFTSFFVIFIFFISSPIIILI